MVRKRKKPGFVAALFLFAVFLALAPAALPAEEEGIESSTNLELQLSSQIEARAILSQSFTFPFLQGSGPLTSGNNITTVLSLESTPVSINGMGEIIWEPAAFFLLSGGGRLGSGWNIPLGKGIGINRPVGGESDPKPRQSKIEGDAFDGLLWGVWGAGTLQFDLGALIPGDWTHILFRTRQELRYSAYTRAGPGDFWVFEHDDRNNKNGWLYYASFLLGYYMPASPLLDIIGFMAEITKPLYKSPGGDVWGEALGRWSFTTMFQFKITPRFTTTLAIQMRTRSNFGTGDFVNEDIYYPDLTLTPNKDSLQQILFHRVALVMNYKLR